MGFKSPVEVAQLISNAGEGKDKMRMLNLIILSFLAGAYIAFGGLLAIIAKTGFTGPIGLSKFIFGAVFPVGLILVVLAGSELFTGNCMFLVMALLDKKATVKGLAKNWIVSWFFNFIGAIFVAYVLAFMTGIVAPTGTGVEFAKTAVATTTAKMNLTWIQAFLRAIGCNWLVCLAVYLALASDDVVGKIVGIWFPIMAFVTIGFEHSVANMFFLPLGLFCGAATSWSAIIVNNLIPVTIGNIIGGAFFVAFLYWITYLKK